MRELPSVSETEKAKYEQIEKAISNYHFNLDDKQLEEEIHLIRMTYNSLIDERNYVDKAKNFS